MRGLERAVHLEPPFSVGRRHDRVEGKRSASSCRAPNQPQLRWRCRYFARAGMSLPGTRHVANLSGCREFGKFPIWSRLDMLNPSRPMTAASRLFGTPHAGRRGRRPVNALPRSRFHRIGLTGARVALSAAIRWRSSIRWREDTPSRSAARQMILLSNSFTPSST